MSKTTELAAALAHEFGMHIDNLVDDAELNNTLTTDKGATLLDAEDEPIGRMLDTTLGDNPGSFIVVMADGKRLLVQVSEAEAPLQHDCYGGQWTVHSAHDYDLASGRKAHCPGKTAETVLGYDGRPSV